MRRAPIGLPMYRQWPGTGTMTAPSNAPQGAVDIDGLDDLDATPHFIDVIEGKTYLWCACGRSANQPFCDGSHEGSGDDPVEYTARTTRRVMFCGCKASKRPPICDGSHNNA